MDQLKALKPDLLDDVIPALFPVKCADLLVILYAYIAFVGP
jgi:hypothetical protein